MHFHLAVELGLINTLVRFKRNFTSMKARTNNIEGKARDPENMGTGTVRLCPVHESFNVDDGFSIHDLKDIGLQYGTRGDFERMLKKYRDKYEFTVSYSHWLPIDQDNNRVVVAMKKSIPEDSRNTIYLNSLEKILGLQTVKNLAFRNGKVHAYVLDDHEFSFVRIEERVIRLVLINSSQLESKSINILESIPIAKSAEIVAAVESVNMTGDPKTARVIPGEFTMRPKSALILTIELIPFGDVDVKHAQEVPVRSDTPNGTSKSGSQSLMPRSVRSARSEPACPVRRTVSGIARDFGAFFRSKRQKLMPKGSIQYHFLHKMIEGMRSPSRRYVTVSGGFGVSEWGARPILARTALFGTKLI
nr:PREDICTED: uncharacterized protein LOC109032660 [Bemisia tabaci]